MKKKKPRKKLKRGGARGEGCLLARPRGGFDRGRKKAFL